jgi:hypothetical protein
VLVSCTGTYRAGDIDDCSALRGLGQRSSADDCVKDGVYIGDVPEAVIHAGCCASMLGRYLVYKHRIVTGNIELGTGPVEKILPGIVICQ